MNVTVGGPVSWARHFDAVYVIHCVSREYAQKWSGMKAELRRVGLLRSPILKIRETVAAPVFKDYGREYAVTEGRVDVTLAAYRIFQEALSLGEDRILVIEEDARFLDDLARLNEILEALPDVYDVAQFSWNLYWPYANLSLGQMREVYGRGVDGIGAGARSAILSDVVKLNPVGTEYFKPDRRRHGALTSSACNALSRKAMEAFAERYGSGRYSRDAAINDYMWTEGKGLLCIAPKTRLCVDADNLRFNQLVPAASDGYNVNPKPVIDWKNYVDAVYLIHFTGDSHKERLPNILSELGRVGIGTADVRIKYTANSRWHDAAAEKCKSEHPGWNLPGWWADVGMATFDILVEALATGLDSIAVFETDCAFIKDTDLLKRYLDTIPENAGIAKLEWFSVGGEVSHVAPPATGSSAGLWEPASGRTSGAACYIIRRNGMEELLRVLSDFCPGPSDFAMNFCNTDIYLSKGHAAIQRAYPSSRSGGCNAYGKMDLSPYSLPEGYVHSSGECRRPSDDSKGNTDSGSVVLPSFPVAGHLVPDAVRTLSGLMRTHKDYRDASCLMARILYQSSPISNRHVVRMLLEQGLSVKRVKPGLPSDEWCWNGGPEKLLAELSKLPIPPGAPGSEQYIVM